MLNVEIANSPSTQARGLMFRTKLASDAGMVFVFNKPQTLKFWGLNTFVPLDIAFVDSDNRITQISNIKTCSDRLVESSKKCIMAIEANLGYFGQHKICIGDVVLFNKNDNKQGSIFFRGPSRKEAQRIVDFDSETDDDIPTYDVAELSEYLEDELEDQQDQDMIDEVKAPGERVMEPVVEDPADIHDHLPPAEPAHDVPELKDVSDASQWGTQNQRTMRIWYKTRRGTDIEREVEPHGQFVARTTGNRILVTYDKTVGDIRAFIMDNILYHSFSNDRFEPKFILEQSDEPQGLPDIEKPEYSDKKMMLSSLLHSNPHTIKSGNTRK